ncbi:hypothetical protein SETIT_9G096200v2 [Setaria italica]|uniref:Uncharacterized protein n=1 Tax=Setaria italica TaxID=4555 RepID=A0A368SEU7_SETIT|nr:hypothetical protein SETIT_9G096200v2 [Setaria italica]
MPKRRSGERGGGRAAKRSRRRHLYLVLDDWWWGYSIRKVNLSSSGSDSDDSTEPLQPQAFPPEHPVPPAVFRVEAQHGFPHTSRLHGGLWLQDHRRPVHEERVRVPPLGTEHVGPRLRPPPARLHARPSAGGGSGPAHLHPRRRRQDLRPVRRLLPGARPTVENARRRLQMHPFSMNAVTVERLSVSSYAVHPDGRTIFVSTESGGTFTFDTAAEHLGWTEHGRWALPFAGRAHFDPTFVPRVPMTYRLGLLRSTRY